MMRAYALFVGGLSIALLCVAGGCDDSVEGRVVAGSGGAGASGGPGGQGGEGGQGAGPVTCSFEVASHEDACPGASCPIVADVEVRCTEGMLLGSAGIRVVPAPAGTYLATSSVMATHFFEIRADGGRPVDGFPLKFIGHAPLLLAQDTDGAVLAVADQRVGGPNAESLMLVRTPGVGFTMEAITTREVGTLSPLDFEVNASGVRHVWNENAPLSKDNSLWTSPPNGMWSESNVGTRDRFTLDASGAPVWIGRHVTDAGIALQYGDPPKDLGTPKPYDPNGLGNPLPYRVTHGSPMALDPAAPPIVAVLQHDEGLRVVWPDGDSFGEILVPETAVPSYVCPPASELPGNPPCAPDCHETATGIEHEAFAVTRTQDGAAWLAWVVHSLDYVHVYAETCFEGNLCFCDDGPPTDVKTKSELVLARVAPGASQVEKVLTLPIDRVSAFNYNVDFRGEARLVDVRAFGSEIAVGLRLEDDKGAKLRVLRIKP
ncbi:hypothetical protein [Polyangium sp. 6x1]|uniref:hypothetical protein n=1 Tax=Polyangium sp. 6x1 TaxID=3042689 RepID=UPI0024832CDE|nr:hypothetical protein [Polyangium sp. 6x1]MDI1450753.1 hypothetical protein [Polyangium sp. 6x1]